MLALRTYYIQNKYVLYTIGDIDNDNLIYDYYIKPINTKGTTGTEMFFFDKWNGKYIELLENEISPINEFNKNTFVKSVDKLIRYNNSMNIIYVKNNVEYKKTLPQMTSILKPDDFRLVSAVFNRQRKCYYEPNYNPYVDECIKIADNEYVKIKQKYKIYLEKNGVQKAITLLDATNEIVPLFDALDSFQYSFTHGENREVSTLFNSKTILVFEGAE